MGIYAVLSDIHGNYEALLAVARDARQIAKRDKRGEITFISLGDVVDYGPRPSECLKWVNRYVRYAVRGNHDEYIAQPDHQAPITLNAIYLPITVWTRTQISLKRRENLLKWQKVFIPDRLPDFTLFHDSLDPLYNYLRDADAAKDNFLQLTTPFGLFGHTHFQGAFSENHRGEIQIMRACDPRTLTTFMGWTPIPINTWHSLPNQWTPTLFNPGSVGQPRQSPAMQAARELEYADYRPAYLLLDTTTQHYQFRRVSAYDVTIPIKQLETIKWDASRLVLTHPPEPDIEKIIQNNDHALPHLIASKLSPYLQGRTQ